MDAAPLKRINNSLQTGALTLSLSIARIRLSRLLYRGADNDISKDHRHHRRHHPQHPLLRAFPVLVTRAA